MDADSLRESFFNKLSFLFLISNLFDHKIISLIYLENWSCTSGRLFPKTQACMPGGICGLSIIINREVRLLLLLLIAKSDKERRLDATAYISRGKNLC